MSSIKIRLRLRNGVTRVRTLISHPMETGRRTDPATGAPIPAHFIEQLTVHHNSHLIARCRLGPGISKDPYVSFKFKGGKVGDAITIEWIDNLGNRDSAKAAIKKV